MVSPSCHGLVSNTDRDSPVLRPTVVSSSTGMLPAVHPIRPPDTVSRPRCIVFIILSAKSLGIP